MLDTTVANEAPDTAVTNRPLVDIRDLKMYFPLTRGVIFQRLIGYVRAVDGISFSIRRGQTMGLVGESGSGKTTIGRTIVRLYRPTAGQMLFDGKDMAKLRELILLLIEGSPLPWNTDHPLDGQSKRGRSG